MIQNTHSFGKFWKLSNALNSFPIGAAEKYSSTRNDLSQNTKNLTVFESLSLLHVTLKLSFHDSCPWSIISHINKLPITTIIIPKDISFHVLVIVQDSLSTKTTDNVTELRLQETTLIRFNYFRIDKHIYKKKTCDKLLFNFKPCPRKEYSYNSYNQ